MANRNKMLEGMIIGAAIGAAVSLFDRETREQFIHNTKKISKKTVEVIKHPQEITNTLKENIHQVRTTFEDISDDVKFIVGKVSELNETTPEMLSMVKETQEAFTRVKQNTTSRGIDELER